MVEGLCSGEASSGTSAVLSPHPQCLLPSRLQGTFSATFFAFKEEVTFLPWYLEKEQVRPRNLPASCMQL